MFALGIAAEGWPVYRAWLGALAAAPFPGNEYDGSAWQVVTRVCDPASVLGHFASCGWATPAVGGALAAVICAATLWRLLSPSARPASVDARWLLATSGALLASPKGWVYYGLWLVPSAVGVWHTGSRTQQRWLMAAMGLTLLPWSLIARAGQPSPWASLTLGSVFFWAFLFCWLAAWLERPER